MSKLFSAKEKKVKHCLVQTQRRRNSLEEARVCARVLHVATGRPEQNLLDLIRGECQSLPAWTLDLEPPRLAGATVEADQEVQLSDGQRARALEQSTAGVPYRLATGTFFLCLF